MPCGPESNPEALTRQFYDWELRGRGWTLFDAPVWPEPPFERFRGHIPPNLPARRDDDGRRPSFLGRILDSLKSRGESAEDTSPSELSDAEPRYIESAGELL